MAVEIGGIGHSVKRKEDARFIRGQGNYLDDMNLPGMLHSAILRSPYAHARIKSINADRARSHPGVAAVITAAELPPYRKNPSNRHDIIFADPGSNNVSIETRCIPRVTLTPRASAVRENDHPRETMWTVLNSAHRMALMTE